MGGGWRVPLLPDDAGVTAHVARLEFPRETGLILRCAGKAGNPFQIVGWGPGRLQQGLGRINGQNTGQKNSLEAALEPGLSSSPE